ncbi:MAG: electron transfer flavoprotein subunit alpha/FixB family protein [Saprospiraceae bacterium]|nr:electron transfer flavoprotein subunit alpha/FixB family protein [Saprospiraceae bacterium]
MVLVFAESTKGKFKKSALETVTYGRMTAEAAGLECAVLTLGEVEDAGQLGAYGASKVYNLPDASLNNFDDRVYTAAIAAAAEKLGAQIIILPHSFKGKALLGRLAVRLEAGSVAAVNAVPEVENGTFLVEKPVFSGKAFAKYEIKTDIKLLSLMGNSFQPEATGEAVTVEELQLDLPGRSVEVVEVNRVEGRVPLPEAEKVVSGGRGLKGPENWELIEELADVLSATTACSRPVADSGWRPHHEHVGQTGIAIRPNLYIAIGISGAIQHLAGVNNSQTIVVINKDPEAPFFKAADYGVVADLFEVVPRLTEALRDFKGE